MKSFLRLLLVPLGLALFSVRPRRVQVEIGTAERRFNLWIDVSRTGNTNRLTGIERVVESLSKELTLATLDNPELTIRFFTVSALGVPKELPSGWWDGETRTGKIYEDLSEAVFTTGDVVFFLDLGLAPNGLNNREMNHLSRKNVKTIHLVYDFLPILHPGLFPARKRLVFLYWVRALSNSSAIVFISRTVQSSMALLPPALTRELTTVQRVIPLGPLETTSARVPLATSGFAKEHFVSIGTLEPRKDYSGLLDAFEMAWAQEFDWSLSIIGREGWKSSQLVKRIKRHPELGKRLFWHRDTLDEELVGLLKSSSALIANSIDEGFGLPLIEASFLGVPVLARDIPAFREVAPWAHFFEAPLAGDLVQALRKWVSLDKSARRQEFVSNGSWSAASRTILKIAAEVHKTRSD